MMKTKTTATRRVLALFMSVLMLMTAWVFVAPTKAAAAVTQQSDLPTFTFYVPETIYLNPADNKTFQYYVDRAQSVNGSLTASNSDTSAWYYFKCDTATSVTSLTCGASNPTLSKTSSSNGELKGLIRRCAFFCNQYERDRAGAVDRHIHNRQRHLHRHSLFCSLCPEPQRHGERFDRL